MSFDRILPEEFAVPALAGMVIDAMNFARGRKELNGALSLGACGRLATHLVDTEGALYCRVIGERDDEGRSFLNLRIEGQVRLFCQRCLLPVERPLLIESRLLLVPPGGAWPADDEPGGLDDESVDAIEGGGELALSDLIEEEVLLALPMVPRHEVCQSLAGEGTENVADVAFDEQKPSRPFAVLAALKKNH